MREELLEDIFEFIRNGASIKQSAGKGGCPITRIETIWNRTIDTERFGYADLSDEGINAYEKYLMKNGDILMSHINSPKHLGKCAIYNGQPDRLIHGMNLLSLRADQAVSFPKYLNFYFNSNYFKVQLIKISNQSVNQASFSSGKLKKLTIPLPPLDQQKKIAAILDAADAYRQKTKALITKYEELTQSLFLDMFGDPVRNPMGWKVVLMKEACTKVTDGTHDTPLRLTEGIKFITGKHIRPYTVDYNNSDYVTKDVHDEIFRRCNPALGDVLYTNIGVNLGTAALNKVEYEFSMKNVALLKPKSAVITGRYMEYFLNSENMKEKIVWTGSLGGAQQFLSLTLLRRLKINLPPLDLQNQFAERVQAIEIQKVQAQASLEQAEDLFNSLLQKAFKGELV